MEREDFTYMRLRFSPAPQIQYVCGHCARCKCSYYY